MTQVSAPAPQPAAFRTSVRSLWEWVPGSLRRLYHVRLVSALVICLPGAFLVTWYAWAAVAAHEEYNHAGEGVMPLTLELFHLHLHDELREDWRSLTSPSPPRSSKVPRYDLLVDGAEYSELFDVRVTEGRRPYINGLLQRDGRELEVEIRYRGRKHWHWSRPQRSLKVRVLSTGLLEDARTFNFINEVTPLGIGEDVLLDLAENQGLLTPTHHPARLRINHQDMGVYFFLAQPEEALLRQASRVTGSIFSGTDAARDPATGQSLLFHEATEWKKVAKAKGESDDDLRQLERFLQMIATAPVEELEGFARDQLDLERFATFEALDVIFGGDQHDFDQNHKLYCDPYRGRFEPIAWNFRGWKHEPKLHLVQNPITIRLGLLPHYVALRNRTIHEYLLGPCSVSALQSRLRKTLRKVAPDLTSDPHWDAYKLLPGASPYLRRMVRPMDGRRQALAIASELATFAQRHAFLLERIEGNHLRCTAGAWRDGVQPMLVEADGCAGYRLEGCRVEGQDDTTGAWTLFADTSLDGNLDPEHDELVVQADTGSYGEARLPGLELHPLARILRREHPTELAGDVELAPLPGHYVFFLQTETPPTQVTLRVRNLVTDAVVSARATPGPLSLADLQVDRGGGAGLEPDTTSRHPWCSPPPWPQVRELGPGELPVDRTWEFQPNEIVQVHAGTRFQLAPGASLVFRGAVEMRGTARAPITFEPAVADQPWGGIALQGDGTTGSILENVQIRGGSTPAWQLVTYPGVLCVHDTRQITLRRVTVRDQAPGSDGIHTAYVEDLLMEECRFQRPTGDGMDLEFTDGTLRSCTVAHAAEDGLDTMGSRLLLQDCVFLGCTDSAVSAGQRSRVELRQSLLAGSRRGALVKSASSLKLTGTLLYRNGTALRREAREVLYSGIAELESDVVFCVRNEEILDAPGKDPIDIVRISRKLPADHSLDHLLLGVLEQDTWEEAQAWIDQRLNGE